MAITELNKFRGKTFDGRWVHGAAIQHGARCFILAPSEWGGFNWEGGSFGYWVEHIEVDPATVGQYTYIDDKRGHEIYKGDVVRLDANEPHTSESIAEVVWVRGCYYVQLSGSNYRLGGWIDNIEVIGNIHDNAELIPKTREEIAT